MQSKHLSQLGLITFRGILALLLTSGGLLLAVIAFGQAPVKRTQADWPSVTEQLAQEYLGHNVQPGTALEALIRDNQEFAMLRSDEKADGRALPAWLRVWWRKGHPELEYRADDPTGGYPLVLKETLEWMLTHQDLKAGPGIAQPTPAGSEADEERASSTGDLRVSGLQTAPRSESDIRVNYWDATKVVSASNNIVGSGQQGIYYSTNGGANWAQTVLPLVSGDLYHSDPTVDWTPDGRVWSSAMGIQDAGNTLRLRNYFSTDNGATWTFDATPSGSQTSVDKQMVWVDHSATSPFQGQMYAIWHNGPPAFMNRRTAGAGGTWLPNPIQVSGAESAGTAIGSDVKTNRMGDVFGAWPATGGQKLFIVKSTNGGASYSAPVQIASTFDAFEIILPAFATRKALIYVSLGAYRTASVDHVYATWTDLAGGSGCNTPANEPGTNVASACKSRVWFARSVDGGATWSAPMKINDQAGLNDQFNQWLVVDETNGGLAVIYYDTVADAGRKKTDIYYQSSANGGVSWSSPFKVTSAATDETSAGSNSGNQYGDYNALSGYANTFFPSWTDRRNNAREEIWTAKITDSFVPAPVAAAANSSVASGGCSNLAPGAVNPGLPVTVNLCVGNTGDGNAANIVGTLQATGGVTSPTGPATYGAINAGTTKCQSFSFTPTGNCGATVTATLQVSDGATNLGNVTYSFKLGAPKVVYTENFDGVSAPALPAGWVAMNASATPAPTWVTSTAAPDSGANAAFVENPIEVSDKQLVSAPIAIATSYVQLTFRNSYNLEAGYDGGVLEISSPNINAGQFTDITNAAVGGSFSSEGYDTTLSTAHSNPIGGRAAWTGNSNGYVTTVANLGPNLAGQNIKLRFRMGSDNSAAGTGWRVDTLSLSDGGRCAPVPLSAVSRKIHNGVNHDVPLPLGGSSGVEPRNPGANQSYQIVLSFANPITIGGATVASGGGNVTSASAAGSQAIIDLQSVPNAQTTTVAVNDITQGSNFGCVNVPVGILVGDSNGDRAVNSGDAAQVRSRSGQLTSPSNFRSDVNLTGDINSGDTIIVRSRSGTGLP